jgi:hypothetical protein
MVGAVLCVSLACVCGATIFPDGSDLRASSSMTDVRMCITSMARQNADRGHRDTYTMIQHTPPERCTFSEASLLHHHRNGVLYCPVATSSLKFKPKQEGRLSNNLLTALWLTSSVWVVILCQPDLAMASAVNFLKLSIHKVMGPQRSYTQSEASKVAPCSIKDVVVRRDQQPAPWLRAVMVQREVPLETEKHTPYW